MKILQSSVSEPDHSEDWEHLPVKEKDKIIRFQAGTIAILLLAIIVIASNRF